MDSVALSLADLTQRLDRTTNAYGMSISKEKRARFSEWGQALTNQILVYLKGNLRQ